LSYKNARTARTGVYAVGRIIEEELEWIFREQQIEDYGIDAHIEVCVEGKPTGKMIASQIKSGESWFSTKNEEGFIYKGSLRHFDYWTQHSLPVILILYNPKLKQAWWVPIESDRIQLFEDKWEIVVPFSFIFDSRASEKLKPYALPDYRKRKELQELLNKNLKINNGIRMLLDALNIAETSIDMVFPYIDSALFWGIKTLSHRVRIRLITSDIIPEDVKQEIMQLANESQGLDVRIWFDSDGDRLFHEKNIIVDNIFVIYGSANLTKYSLRESQEIILAKDDKTTISQFTKRFNKIWKNSIKIDMIKNKRITKISK